jgi:mercuric reductase
MNLAEVPKSLIVVGGGYVGLEQAQTFADLGVDVTLVGRFAPQTEPEVRAVLADAFAAHGIKVREQRATGVNRGFEGQVDVTLTDGTVITAQRLLLATGRSPNTAGLELGLAGVSTDAAGFIQVDAEQRTGNPRVFAAGDVTGGPQFVYVAAAAGRAAAGFALDIPGARAVDYTGLPAVIFTNPQLASVGLTEQQVLAGGGKCESRTLTAGDLPRALVNGDPYGAVKIVADPADGRVLGVHAALDGAGELMLAATYAIKAGMTVDDIAGTWAPYLTMSEALRLTAGLWRSDKPTSCCA